MGQVILISVPFYSHVPLLHHNASSLGSLLFVSLLQTEGSSRKIQMRSELPRGFKIKARSLYQTCQPRHLILSHVPPGSLCSRHPGLLAPSTCQDLARLRASSLCQEHSFTCLAEVPSKSFPLVIPANAVSLTSLCIHLWAWPAACTTPTCYKFYLLSVCPIRTSAPGRQELHSLLFTAGPSALRTAPVQGRHSRQIC